MPESISRVNQEPGVVPLWKRLAMGATLATAAAVSTSCTAIKEYETSKAELEEAYDELPEACQLAVDGAATKSDGLESSACSEVPDDLRTTVVESYNKTSGFEDGIAIGVSLGGLVAAAIFGGIAAGSRR